MLTTETIYSIEGTSQPNKYLQSTSVLDYVNSFMNDTNVFS